MDRFQQPYLPYPAVQPYDGSTAVVPGQPFFTSPISYGHLPFGPRSLPQQAIPYLMRGQVPAYTNQQPPAFHAPRTSSGSPLSPAHFVPFTPIILPHGPAPPVGTGYRQSLSAGRVSLQQSAMSVTEASSAQQAAPSTQQQEQPGSKRQSTSPALSRTSSSRHSSAVVPFVARREEPRKRRLVVRLPPGAPDSGGTTTKRCPLSQEKGQEVERHAGEEYTSFVMLDSGHLVTREQHFDELRSATLPPSLDVYLPGRLAWQDVLDDMQDSTRIAQEDDPELCDPALRPRVSDHPSAPFAPFTPFAPFGEDSPVSQPGVHRRAKSLFSSASNLPPRLRDAVESLRGGVSGHRTTASMLPAISSCHRMYEFYAPAAISTPERLSLAAGSYEHDDGAQCRTRSYSSSRTDATGVASPFSEETVASEGADEVEHQVTVRARPSAARSSELAIPRPRSNDFRVGDEIPPVSDVDAAREQRAVPTVPIGDEPHPPLPTLTFGDPVHHRIASWPQESLRSNSLRDHASNYYGRAEANEPAHRLTQDGADFSFATHGQPGSLTASPGFGSGLSSPAFSPAWQLNALASNFVPTALHAPADGIASAGPTASGPATALFSSQSSSGRRPLPPLPTAATTQLSRAHTQGTALPNVPRLDVDPSLFPAIELVHPQPRRPLPTPPIPRSSPSVSEETSSAPGGHSYAHAAVDPEDGVNRSSLSLDDPLPEQYKPPRSILRGRLGLTAVSALHVRGASVAERGGAERETTSPARAAEASPARMGDPRAHRGPDVPFEQSPSRYLPSVNSPASDRETGISRSSDPTVPVLDPVISRLGDHTLPELESFLTARFERLHAAIAAQSTCEMQTPQYRFTQLLADLAATQQDLVAETRDLARAHYRELAALLRSLSRRLDAIPQDVAAALRPILFEKVDLEPVRSTLEALPTILGELRSLRGLVEQQRGLQTPSDDGFAASASTLVRSVDSVGVAIGAEMEPKTPPLAAEFDPDAGDEQSAWLTELRLVDAKVATLDERLASQERHAAQLFEERKLSRTALETAMKRKAVLEQMLGFFGSDDVYEDDASGYAAISFHGDAGSGQSQAYTCDSDGWYSAIEAATA